MADRKMLITRLIEQLKERFEISFICKKTEVELRNVLFRFAKEMAPSIDQVYFAKHYTRVNKNRAKQAEGKLAKICEVAERALCDETEKNDLLRALEAVVKECGFYETGFDDSEER